MEIIIGREVGTKRLHVTIDGNKEFSLGDPGSVPQTVSKTHCKLVIDGKKNITIQNIKDNNCTYVDGDQIIQKSITPNSKVQLSPSRYTLPLKEILNKAGLITEPEPGQGQRQGQGPAPQIYSLRHLEGVWKQYESERLAEAKRRTEEAAKQRMWQSVRFALLGVGALVTAVGAATEPIIPIITGLMTIGIAISMLINAHKTSKEEPLAAVNARIDDKYRQYYCCPNPECGRPFGYKNYLDVKFIKKCPACGCKYSA